MVHLVGVSFGHIIWRVLDSQPELQELWTVQICVLYLLCSFKKVSGQSVMFCKRSFLQWVLMTFAVGLSLCLVAERSTQYPVLCFDGCVPLSLVYASVGWSWFWCQFQLVKTELEPNLIFGTGFRIKGFLFIYIYFLFF
jgi:hypothetical protein